MQFTLEKLKARIPEIIAAAVRDSLPVDDAEFGAAPGPVAASAREPPPPPDAAGWAPIWPGELGAAPDCPHGSSCGFGIYKLQKGFTGFVPWSMVELGRMYPVLEIWRCL